MESFIKDDKEKYLHLKQITKNFWDEYPKERERIIKQIKERLMKADHVPEEEKEESAKLLDSFLKFAEVDDYYLYRVNHDPQERLELLSEMVFTSAEKDQNNDSKILQYREPLQLFFNKFVQVMTTYCSNTCI